MGSYIKIQFIFGLILLATCSCQPESNFETVQTHDTVAPTKADTTNRIKIDSSLFILKITSNLIWMKNDFSVIKGRYMNDWNEIHEWTEEINKNNYAGYNDWRVPTIKEYRTINNNSSDRKIYRTEFNSIDSTCVWGTGPYGFWSSNTPNANTASYISFIDGFATSGNKAKQFSNPYSDWKGVELGMSVRLVRDIK